MVYLRSRYYAPETGRFLTRDVWTGDYTRPLSLNGWHYVGGNPINLVDPSGHTPLFGDNVAVPDITAWLQSEMQRHYAYGLLRKGDVQQMKVLTNIYWATRPFSCAGLYPDLYEVATMNPHNVIVDEVTVLAGIPVGKLPATTEVQSFPLGLAGPIGMLLDEINTVNFLAALEYGAYGLAVDYSSVIYSPTPKRITDADNPQGGGKQVVTICGKAQDVSDIGNMMFGLGGQARGYSLDFVYPSAAAFNGLSGEGIASALGPDGKGAIVGWTIGAFGAYSNVASMCSVIANFDSLGFAWRDNADQLSSWLPADVVGQGIPANGPSALLRVSGGAIEGSRSTIPELMKKLAPFPFIP